MENFTEKLIECVKENKILYDLSHEDYKNIRKKNKIWDEIGKLLEIDGEETKKNFKNLRDCYAKHLRTEKTHTGQKAKFTARYRMWPWVEQMSYFRPFLQFAQTQSNISHADNENDNDFEHQLLTPLEDTVDVRPIIQETTRNVTTRKRKLPDRVTDRDTTSSSHQLSAVNKVLSYLNKSDNMQQNYDELDLIFLGYAKSLKKMNPLLQTTAKFKIAQVMMEIEIQHHTENENSVSGQTESRSSNFFHLSPQSNSQPAYSPEDSNENSITHSEHSTATTWYEEFSQTQF